MADFFAAFNAVDRAKLEAIIGHGPQPNQAFQWLAWPDKAEYTPVAAHDLLMARAQRGDRLHLHSLNVNGATSWHGGVDFELRAERTGGPLTTATFIGKGALSCAARRIYVLALGEPSR